jgi:lysine decarboxylase
MAMSIRQAYFAEKESVSLKDAVGRVSADFIYQYPPGSPLLIPGDYVTAEIAEFIDCYTAQLTGIYGNTMKVVRT